MHFKTILIFATIVLMLAGAFMAAIWSSQQNRRGQSFTLDEEGAKGAAAKNDVGELEDGEGDGSDAERAELLAQQASQRAADLQLFLEEPYFRLPVITVPIIRNEKMMGILHLRIVMKSVDHEGFQLGKVLTPRLVDAIFYDLYCSLANLWLPQRDPTYKALLKRMHAMTTKTLGPKRIQDIYIKELFFTRYDY